MFIQRISYIATFQHIHFYSKLNCKNNIVFILPNWIATVFFSLFHFAFGFCCLCRHEIVFKKIEFVFFYRTILSIFWRHIIITTATAVMWKATKNKQRKKMFLREKQISITCFSFLRPLSPSNQMHTRDNI